MAKKEEGRLVVKAGAMVATVLVFLFAAMLLIDKIT